MVSIDPSNADEWGLDVDGSEDQSGDCSGSDPDHSGRLDVLELAVDTRPVGKQRARVTHGIPYSELSEIIDLDDPEKAMRRLRQVVADLDPQPDVYTPEKTATFESKIEWAAADALPEGWPTDARYRVGFSAVYPDARTADIDNICKAILDGLQGVAFDDDAQVRQLGRSELRVDRELECGRIEVRVEVVE